MKADYIDREDFGQLLAALTPPNRLAMEISAATGLRISDVLGLRTEALEKAARITVREKKTGKPRRLTIPAELRRQALEMAGAVYIFEGRLETNKPRTRDAVLKDVKRVAKVFRLKQNVAPHSARKLFAVEAYRRTGDLKKVQALLQHKFEGVTMLYAMADQLTARRQVPRAPGAHHEGGAGR